MLGVPTIGQKKKKSRPDDCVFSTTAYLKSASSENTTISYSQLNVYSIAWLGRIKKNYCRPSHPQNRKKLN